MPQSGRTVSNAPPPLEAASPANAALLASADLQATAAYETVRTEGDPPGIPRPTRRGAVRELLEHLAARAPGNSVELRVPPDGVTQMVEGPRHRRGTPPATVEMPADTLIGLCLGRLTWRDEVARGTVRASGERADLSGLFPIVRAASSQSQPPGKT